MPSAELVDSFAGLAHGKDPLPAFSPRRALDTPRELLNLAHDEHGQLWLPPAAAAPFHSFGAGLRVRHIANIATTTTGTALIVQVGSAVHIFNTAADPLTVETLIADIASSDTIWVNATDPAVYIGTQQKTWKVTGGAGARVVTDISANADMYQGFHSMTYKGRRFLAIRNQTIRFSEINQPETFLADNTFTVGGDQTGGSWSVHPGSVVALMELENILLIFCTNSVWALTGTAPANFQLRRTNSVQGAWARDSVVRTDQGVLFVGGTPQGEMGVHLFTGNQAAPVSDPISGFFREWSYSSGSFADASQLFSAVRWRDRYILSASPVAGDRQVYVYNLRSRSWSTLSGWVDGPALGLARFGGGLDRLVCSNGPDLYVTDDPLVRAPAAPEGRVVLGWHDQGRPAGHARFLGAKVGAWAPAGNVTLDARAAVPGSSATRLPSATSDFHRHPALPIRLRGKAIEFDLRLGGTGSGLLESLELIFSRKGEKLSRE